MVKSISQRGMVGGKQTRKMRRRLNWKKRSAVALRLTVSRRKDVGK